MYRATTTGKMRHPKPLKVLTGKPSGKKRARPSFKTPGVQPRKRIVLP